MAISPRGVVRSTSCLVLQWGFRGRRIEWRYFRFRLIQDGGAAAIWKNSNGDISAADRPIYFVFGSRMGFSRLADRMALFLVSPNPRWRRSSRHLEKFKWRYLSGGSSDLLHVWFKDGVFEVGGSNGAISGFAKPNMAAAPPSWKIQMAISPRRIVRFTPCLVLGWGFRGWRSDWRYFRFRQIQDGAILKKSSNGDISAADRPICTVFGSRMRFSWSADFNGANSGLTKFNRYVGENNARGVIRLVTI